MNIYYIETETSLSPRVIVAKSDQDCLVKVRNRWGNDLKSILVIYEVVAINKVRDIYQRR